MHKLGIAALVVGALWAPRAAHAFCGFYVAGSDEQMVNDATQVVLMRAGTRTVLAMQNDYKGPLEDFAIVIPVPAVLHDGDVKILPKEVFERVEKMGAPRLVEYWEQDPCPDEASGTGRYGTIGHGAGTGNGYGAGGGRLESRGVTVEAEFAVGEYQIVILSAQDSTGLEGWLHDQHYTIPAGAEPLLRPYVESGMKFFVAKVDPKKVVFDHGHVALSPLRFHYDSEQFALPIRLGLANSAGTQDLIVNIFAPDQRYEVANYPNVTIPTNLDVKDSVKARFGAFYAALFDRTVEQHRGAVVTEYAWQAMTCDPCPGPTLSSTDLVLLGADVITPGAATPARARRRGVGGMFGMVMTRLHARYGRDLKDDLVFRAAPPIVGGRELVADTFTGSLEQGARPAPRNNFQARYAIRHEWAGPIKCEHPVRRMWGGPPAAAWPDGYEATRAATGLAFAPRDQVALDSVLVGAAAAVPAADLTAIPHPTQPAGRASAGGCGCASSDPAGLALALPLGLLAIRRPGARRRRLRPTRYSCS